MKNFLLDRFLSIMTNPSSFSSIVINDIIQYARSLHHDYDVVIAQTNNMHSTESDLSTKEQTNDTTTSSSLPSSNIAHYRLEGLITTTTTEATTNTTLNKNNSIVDVKESNSFKSEQQQQQQKQSSSTEERIVLEKWAEFCSSIFSYKTNPPPSSYFLRHYDADPYHIDPSLIRIARCDSNNDTNHTNNIVASCRLFVKQLSTGYYSKDDTSTQNYNGNNENQTTKLVVVPSSSSYIIAGGIGEVCTDMNHRSRGLSKRLLYDCINIMEHHGTTNQNNNFFFQVSILHAAPSFFPFYRSCGYYNWIQTIYSWLELNLSQLMLLNDKRKRMTHPSKECTTTTKTRTIRLAQFPQDTNQLYKIHQQYSEQRFIGCIIRRIDYWNTYIAQELDGVCYVLVEQQSQQHDDDNDNDNDNDNSSILGWLSIRGRDEGRYQVRDYGCYSIRETSQVFLQLLHYILIDIQQLQHNHHHKTIHIQLPKPIYDEIDHNYKEEDDTDDSKLLLFVNEVIEIDEGWMHKPIIGMKDIITVTTASDVEEETGEQVTNVKSLQRLFNLDLPHVIWSADSF
jgi:predicted GNAT family N-acyltransferase